MSDNPASILDKWRDYFGTSKSNIFDIIEYAIMVAASDFPGEFKIKRDRIAEMLFSFKTMTCLEETDEELKSGIEDVVESSKDTIEISCKINDDHTPAIEELNDPEMEEAYKFVDEVLRIKEILDNSKHQSNDVLFNSLKKIQLMDLSVENLEDSEIGKSVNALRKHGSEDVRVLAKTIIKDWRAMVYAYYNAPEVPQETVKTPAVEPEAVKTPAIEPVKTSTIEPESVKISNIEPAIKTTIEPEVVQTPVFEECGLPCPPMDDGAFNTSISMDLSQVDDDGRLLSLDSSSAPTKGKKAELKKNSEVMLKQTSPVKRNLPPSGKAEYERRKAIAQSKLNDKFKVQRNSDEGAIQKKPVAPQPDVSTFIQKLNCNDEVSIRTKLEAAKRKLQEHYEEDNKAKRQRTIQFIELKDLPKQTFAQRNQNMKPRNHNRIQLRENGR